MLIKIFPAILPLQKAVHKLNDRSNGKPLRVLSEEDWNFWITNGYIVIKNAVPREQALATANFLWEFEEKDPNDPEHGMHRHGQK